MQATFTVHIQPRFMSGSDNVVGATMGATARSMIDSIKHPYGVARAIR